MSRFTKAQHPGEPMPLAPLIAISFWRLKLSWYAPVTTNGCMDIDCLGCKSVRWQDATEAVIWVFVGFFWGGCTWKPKGNSDDGPRSETAQLPLDFPASHPSEQHFIQAMHQPAVPMLRWTMASRCLQWLCLRGGQCYVWFAPGSWLLQLLLTPYSWLLQYSLTAGRCTT